MIFHSYVSQYQRVPFRQLAVCQAAGEASCTNQLPSPQVDKDPLGTVAKYLALLGAVSSRGNHGKFREKIHGKPWKTNPEILGPKFGERIRRFLDQENSKLNLLNL